MQTVNWKQLDTSRILYQGAVNGQSTRVFFLIGFYVAVTGLDMRQPITVYHLRLEIHHEVIHF